MALERQFRRGIIRIIVALGCCDQVGSCGVVIPEQRSLVKRHWVALSCDRMCQRDKMRLRRGKWAARGLSRTPTAILFSKGIYRGFTKCLKEGDHMPTSCCRIKAAIVVLGELRELMGTTAYHQCSLREVAMNGYQSIQIQTPFIHLIILMPFPPSINSLRVFNPSSVSSSPRQLPQPQHARWTQESELHPLGTRR